MKASTAKKKAFIVISVPGEKFQLRARDQLCVLEIFRTNFFLQLIGLDDAIDVLWSKMLHAQMNVMTKGRIICFVFRWEGWEVKKKLQTCDRC